MYNTAAKHKVCKVMKELELETLCRTLQSQLLFDRKMNDLDYVTSGIRYDR